VSVPTALSAATMAGISACVSDHLNRAPAVCAVCDQFVSALDSIDGKKPYRDVEFKTAIAEWKQFLAPYTDAWARRKASVLIVIFRPKSSRTTKPTLGYVSFRAATRRVI